MHKIRTILLVSMLLMILTLTTACNNANENEAKQSNTNKALQVTTTTGMIADIVQNVGQNHVNVTALMGPGVDPHLYKASHGDIAKLEAADIIFYNGLNLEGKMSEILQAIGKQKPVIAVTETIPQSELRQAEGFAGHYDPHVWFDVKLWMKATERVRDALIDIDPAHRTDYEMNATTYLQTLKELDLYAKKQFATIPKERRVLITAHDAFGYMGRAYDLEVVGLMGISTDAEYGLKDVQDLVDMIVTRKIKAVFVETSVPTRSIEAIIAGAKAKGHEVVIGGNLYSDAMGDPGTEQGTYVGMVKHNVDLIVSALQ